MSVLFTEFLLLAKNFSLSHKEKKFLVILFFLSLFFLISIFQADILYVDDLGRVINGGFSWEKDGRPLASLIFYLLQVSGPLTDISPLPQILSVFLYSLSFLNICKCFAQQSTLPLYLSGLIFVISPFNLEVYSFVFDSLSMALSVLVASAAVLIFTRTLSSNIFGMPYAASFLTVFLLLYLVLNLYQFGTSVYLAAGSVVLICSGVTKDITLMGYMLRTFRFLSPLLLSLLVYSLTKDFFGLKQYIESRTEIPNAFELPGVLLGNLVSSYNYLIGLMNKEQFILLFISFSFILSSVIFGYFHSYLIKREKSSRPIRPATILFIIFYLIILIFSSYGLALIFEGGVYRPRYFMGFSTSLALFVLLSLSFCERKTVCKSFVYPCFMFYLLISINVAATYGNSLRIQWNKESLISSIILDDITNKTFGRETEHLPNLVFLNEMPPSPMSKIAFSKFPIIQELVVNHFKPGWFFGSIRMKMLGFERYEILRRHDSCQFFSDDNEKTRPLISRTLYDIYVCDSQHVAIRFKDGLKEASNDNVLLKKKGKFKLRFS